MIEIYLTDNAINTLKGNDLPNPWQHVGEMLPVLQEIGGKVVENLEDHTNRLSVSSDLALALHETLRVAPFISVNTPLSSPLHLLLSALKDAAPVKVRWTESEDGGLVPNEVPKRKRSRTKNDEPKDPSKS